MSLQKMPEAARLHVVTDRGVVIDHGGAPRYCPPTIAGVCEAMLAIQWVRAVHVEDVSRSPGLLRGVVLVTLLLPWWSALTFGLVRRSVERRAYKTFYRVAPAGVGIVLRAVVWLR